MSSTDSWLRRFRVVARVTLGFVYFLILFGASVRASGAGMGCPDWPTCFGMWIPPVSESQLPPNYREIYPYYEGQVFNAVHTWTEYVNRLTGVVVGLLALVTAGMSLPLWRHDRVLPILAVAAVLFTGFAGWLGKEVVGSHLEPWMITAHMAVALAIVGALVWAVARSRRAEYASAPGRWPGWLRAAILVALLISLVQIFLGTQVRQSVDVIADTLGEAQRAEWPAAFGANFYVHRTLSLLVFGVNAAIVAGLRRFGRAPNPVTRLGHIVVAVIAAEIATGAALYYFGMPAALQPVHLLLAAILFGTQFSLWLAARYHSAGDWVPKAAPVAASP